MKHSVYFDGKVQSLELSTSKGRATVVEGRMKTRLPGAPWRDLGPGEKLVVPKGVSFDIDAPGPVAYICSSL